MSKRSVFHSIMFVLVATMVGCKSPTVVVAPSVHERDSINIRTLYVHDTTHTEIWHYERAKDDTVYIREIYYEYAGHDERDKDTVRIVKRDSIPYPVEVPVPVEKPLTGWQQFRMHSGDLLWVAIAVAIVAWLVSLYFKRR